MLLLPLITLISYSFLYGEHLSYKADVSFDGYLPVLRGRQSLATLAMTVDVVRGGQPESDPIKISSEIKEFKMTLNGATLPFGPDNVRLYFPKTTIEASLQGKLLKTDAPNLRLPVHLPGLDIKRLPDITYLPIEFPVEGIEEGKPFKFVKPFGDGPVEYEVTPKSIDADTIAFTINLTQDYVTYEDERKSPTDESKAATKIRTRLTGTGTAVFDRKRGLVREFDVLADSFGQATDIKTQVEVDRRLKTNLRVRLTN